MSEPTDRERVAWALCKATNTINPHCGMSVPCPDCLRLADAAIALGAKPSVDPVEVLANEVRKFVHESVSSIEYRFSAGNLFDIWPDVVRLVLDRAKQLDLS